MQNKDFAIAKPEKQMRVKGKLVAYNCFAMDPKLEEVFAMHYSRRKRGIKEDMPAENIKITRAKELFKYGVLTRADIVSKPMTTGWMAEIVDKEGQLFTIATDRGEIREFKTIDTAFKTLSEIGFENVTITKNK